MGRSKQRPYDPYADPGRAVKEEFGDLLAEGLYARLDHHQNLYGTEISYWTEFIQKRKAFLTRVAESLGRHDERDDNTDRGRETRAAEVSVHAAREQLEGIGAELCHKFIQLWQADLAEWRNYLPELARSDSIGDAFRYLRLDYAESLLPNIR